MSIGFIGTGHITTALVEGLCAEGDAPEAIVLSPRNAEKAAALAARFPSVRVAADNQAVVDAAETVVLAVRPELAEAVAGSLSFRAEQRVLSLLALVPWARMVRLVAPAETVVRAVPIPAAARRLGPIAYFPHEPTIAALLGRVGTPVAAPDEAAFHRLWALTALLSPYFGLMDRLARWAAEGGVERATSGAYLAALFHALGVMAEDAQAGRFAGLAEAAATPGGINEQALALIEARDGFAPFEAALDAVYARMQAGTE